MELTHFLLAFGLIGGPLLVYVLIILIALRAGFTLTGRGLRTVRAKHRRSNFRYIKGGVRRQGSFR